jgi:gliding motility-associated-like protein
MHTPSKFIAILLVFYFSSFAPLVAQSHHDHDGHDHTNVTEAQSVQPEIGKKTPSFIRNDNQWHENVVYQTGFSGTFNGLFLEKNRLTYQVYDQDALSDLHALKDAKNPERIKGHSYHVNFKNSLEANIRAVNLGKEKYNYFIGNDKSKWASNVPAAAEVMYEDIYENTDLRIFRKNDEIKYEFVLAPYANPANIVMEYAGAERIELVNGQLNIYTTVAIVSELAPYTYQVVDGKEREIPSRYILNNEEVSFEIIGDYNKKLPLIIDPTVVAATLSGHNVNGSAGVFGHTACFDSEGNIYAGGLAFGAGYATTTGAFDLDFNGGEDIVISKYNPDGTDLIYATYIGGDGEDYPHSIITDFSQRLYIYGSSNSSDYPTTTSAYQPSTGGGSDIIITVLESDGSGLVGSTHVGGQEDDGINNSFQNKNYGDDFRGEIIIDSENNIYVSSGTQSNDFPIVNGFDNTFSDDFSSSAQDGVVLKMNSDLSLLYWSTFLGGEDPDFAMGMRLDDNENVYVTGFAGDATFPTTPGTVNSVWPGGGENAFVVKIGKNGDELLLGTFWGTSDADEHGYFLDIDEENNIHIYGQSTGEMPITAGVFSSQAGSPQFISAFTPELDEVIYSTVIGEGPGGAGYDFLNNNVDFVPVAFMVDKCNNIYFSGYGASDNLPTTTGSFYNEGNSFYLGVLEPNAAALSFGTYYGRSNHVDGGTSRFDKSGTVYQAVCSCTNSGNFAMNTNANAFETDMPGSTCDVGVFKIDFEVETVTAAGVIIESGTNVVTSSGCAPFDVDFVYTGQDGTGFYWNFGDGDDSTLENPSHVYQNSGSYPVYLVVDNPFTCNQIDTVYLQVDVLDNIDSSRDTSFCDGTDLVIDASVQNATYLWNDGFTGSTRVLDTPGTYWVNVDIGSCARTDTFVVNPPLNLDVNIGPDSISACDVFNYTFDGTTNGAASYEWQDGVTDPIRTVSSEGIFVLTVTDENNCTYSDDALLLFGETPTVNIGPDVILCDGVPYTFDATGANTNVTYTWSDGSTDSGLTTTIGGIYTVSVSDDGCESEDDALLEYFPEFNLDTDIVPIECANDCNASISVMGNGGIGTLIYEWSTGSNSLSISDLCPGTYTLTVTDDECEYITDFDLTNPVVLMTESLSIDLICAGDSSGMISAVNFVGGVPPYTFSLNDGEYQSSPDFTGLDAGNYALNLLDSVGCLFPVNITLTQPPEFFVYAGEDVSIQLGESTQLNGDITPLFGQDILWTPELNLDCNNCLDPELTPPNTQEYTLIATDPETGCFRADSVLVEVIKVRKVFIPSAFSPNLNGVNDEFTVFGHIGVSEVEKFQIWSRWGELLFENTFFPPNKPGFGWDGYHRGRLVNPGVYVYTARVRYYDGEIGLFKGDVTLVR